MHRPVDQESRHSARDVAFLWPDTKNNQSQGFFLPFCTEKSRNILRLVAHNLPIKLSEIKTLVVSVKETHFYFFGLNIGNHTKTWVSGSLSKDLSKQQQSLYLIKQDLPRIVRTQAFQGSENAAQKQHETRKQINRDPGTMGKRECVVYPDAMYAFKVQQILRKSAQSCYKSHFDQTIATFPLAGPSGETIDNRRFGKNQKMKTLTVALFLVVAAVQLSTRDAEACVFNPFSCPGKAKCHQLVAFGFCLSCAYMCGCVSVLLQRQCWSWI